MSCSKNPRADNRDETARPNAWFEHTGMGSMDIHNVRDRTTQLKRVAVHYKKTHALGQPPSSISMPDFEHVGLSDSPLEMGTLLWAHQCCPT